MSADDYWTAGYDLAAATSSTGWTDDDAYLAAVASDEPPTPPEPGEPTPARALRSAEDMTDAEHAALRFDRDVAHRRRQLEVNELAARQLRGERAAERPPVELLTDFLGLDLGDAEYRIDGLLPAGGRAMLAAQYKAGKSTMIGNLIRSLADGDVFLGEHQANPTAGPIVLLDTELDRRMIQDWYTRQGIQRTDRVALISLRGKLSSFDITDPVVLQTWADTLAELQPSVVILDPLRPVLDAIGLDEDKEAGRFLVAFDELLDRAGAGEAVVVHHMGHQGERARGSSRLRDWPDVEWRLLRHDPDDPASPRFFTAYGRDVDVSERELTFNPSLGRLTIFGGSRKDSELQVVSDEILDALENSPGLSATQIDRRLAEDGHTRANTRAALTRLINSRDVVVLPGGRKTKQHYLRDNVPPPGKA